MLKKWFEITQKTLFVFVKIISNIGKILTFLGGKILIFIYVFWGGENVSFFGKILRLANCLWLNICKFAVEL